jgi:hypothetical protein
MKNILLTENFEVDSHSVRKGWMFFVLRRVVWTTGRGACRGRCSTSAPGPSITRSTAGIHTHTSLQASLSDYMCIRMLRPRTLRPRLLRSRLLRPVCYFPVCYVPVDYVPVRYIRVCYVPVHYVPVCFVPGRYIPVCYFPAFLHPLMFHPWMSHNQQNSTNHLLVGQLALPNLTLDMVSHNQQNLTNPWIGWAFSLT